MNALTKKPSLTGTLQRFHEDEGGMTTIEGIVTLAVAAVVMYGIFQLWTSQIKPGIGSVVEALVSWAIEFIA